MRLLLSGLGLNIVLWLLVFFLFSRGNPATILHYSSVIGVDFIGASSRVYILPAAGLICLVTNGLLGYFLRRASRRATTILWSATIPIQGILMAVLVILWQLNQ